MFDSRVDIMKPNKKMIKQVSVHLRPSSNHSKMTVNGCICLTKNGGSLKILQTVQSFQVQAAIFLFKK